MGGNSTCKFCVARKEDFLKREFTGKFRSLRDVEKARAYALKKGREAYTMEYAAAADAGKDTKRCRAIAVAKAVHVQTDILKLRGYDAKLKVCA